MTSPLLLSLPQWHQIAASTPGSALLTTGQIDSDNFHSYLFVHPQEMITAWKLDEIHLAFERLEEALHSGYHLAGFISSEAGNHFEPSTMPASGSAFDPEVPLLWFGVYEKKIVVRESWQGGIDTRWATNVIALR